MKSRRGVPADLETIDAVKGYVARSFPHCRVEAFWTVDPVEYTFVAYDVRNQPVCNVIVDRELFQEYGPDAMREALDDLGLADSLRGQPAPQVAREQERPPHHAPPDAVGPLPLLPAPDVQAPKGILERAWTHSGTSALAAADRSGRPYLKEGRQCLASCTSPPTTGGTSTRT